MTSGAKGNEEEIDLYRVNVPQSPFALARINYVAIIEVVRGSEFSFDVLKPGIDVF